jgi:hypothetical protein
VRSLGGKIESYDAPSTEEIARRTGLDVAEIIRFDGNTSPHLLPSTRAEALDEELARIHTYPHGGYPRLERALADYAGVSPENIVLGAGADDLILLVARAFAGPGDAVAIPTEPTYPLFRLGALLAGATAGDDSPVLTFVTSNAPHRSWRRPRRGSVSHEGCRSTARRMRPFEPRRRPRRGTWSTRSFRWSRGKSPTSSCVIASRERSSSTSSFACSAMTVFG